MKVWQRGGEFTERWAHWQDVPAYTFFSCQSKTEYGVIGVFHKHCALSIRKGSCTCVTEELTHHIRCSEFSRNQLPNSVSDLLAPPAAQSREKSNQRGCMYLTLIYFLPKKKSKQVILLISDFEDGKNQNFFAHVEPMWNHYFEKKMYVSADMEYSSKRSEEDPFIKIWIKYRLPWFIHQICHGVLCRVNFFKCKQCF